MKKNEITEGNKSIAIFAGWVTDDGVRYYNPTNNITIYRTDKDFDYHSNWNTLMSVVDKIETFEDSTDDFEVGYSVSIECYLCEIRNMVGGCISHGFEQTKIMSIWVAVVKFIEWYNSPLSKM